MYYTAVQSDHSARRHQRNVLPRVLRQAWCGATGIRRPRRSSSATTANPSGPRSRCTTWPPGPGSSRAWPAVILSGPTAALAAPPRTGITPAGRRPGALAAVAVRASRTTSTAYGHAVYNLDFAQPGARRRSGPPAGDGEVLPAGPGPRPVRAAAAVGRAAGRTDRPAAGPAWAAPPGRVPGCCGGPRRRAGPRGRPGRRRPGLAAAARGCCSSSGGGWWPPASSPSPPTCSGCAAASCGAPSSSASPAPAAPPAMTGAGGPVRAGAVEERKMLWRGQRRAAAPQLLPESRGWSGPSGR